MALLPIAISIFTLLYFILPNDLLQQAYLRAFLRFCLTLIIAVGLLHLSVANVVYPLYFPEVNISWLPTHLPKLIAPLLDLIIVSALAVVVKLLRDREQQERRQLQLEKINVQNELQILKSQLQPHFLFNTLNGLYAYILEQPKIAAKIVVKLSNLLRYIIYEGDKSLLPLKDDLDCLQNYLDLEEIRYGNRLTTSFHVSGIIQQQQIVPLLLLPFLENAFKHGPARTYTDSWITCNINVKKHSLHMKLSNSKASEAKTCNTSSGIGLKNVKQRLVYYFGQEYELKIENQSKYFSATLTIPLS